MDCPRCRKSEFYLCRDGDDWVVFCMDVGCMKDDSEASKGLSREERSRRMERDSHGVVMTGAEKFRMGNRYKNACFARWLGSHEHDELIQRWLVSLDGSLLICGGPGVGKTYLSACILNFLWERKKEVYYLSHHRFVRDLQGQINIGRTQEEYISKVGGNDIVIFDDLGSGTNTDWQCEAILQLVDYRYSQTLPTVYTSNFKREAMSQSLGDRLTSRVFAGQVMEMWYEDMRQNKS